MQDQPEDFDPIDYALWRLECAIDAARDDVSELTRAALVVAKQRIEEERAARVA